MKFAIFNPRFNMYWKEDGAFRDSWKQARTFLTREDAEQYLNWIQTQYEHRESYQHLIVVQVK